MTNVSFPNFSSRHTFSYPQSSQLQDLFILRPGRSVNWLKTRIHKAGFPPGKQLSLIWPIRRGWDPTGVTWLPRHWPIHQPELRLHTSSVCVNKAGLQNHSMTGGWLHVHDELSTKIGNTTQWNWYHLMKLLIQNYIKMILKKNTLKGHIYLLITLMKFHAIPKITCKVMSITYLINVIPVRIPNFIPKWSCALQVFILPALIVRTLPDGCWFPVYISIPYFINTFFSKQSWDTQCSMLIQLATSTQDRICIKIM